MKAYHDGKIYEVDDNPLLIGEDLDWIEHIVNMSDHGWENVYHSSNELDSILIYKSPNPDDEYTLFIDVQLQETSHSVLCKDMINVYKYIGLISPLVLCDQTFGLSEYLLEIKGMAEQLVDV